MVGDPSRGFPRALRAVILSTVLLTAASGTLPAQERESFPLRDDVRQKLNSLQESWIEWLTSVQAGDAARAVRQADNLVSSAKNLGLPRLPELSIAAAARAERFAREGDLDGAELSLAAAELLDPDRAETAFARATVRGLRGERLGALMSTFRGYWLSLFDPLYRYVLLGDVLLWCLAIVTLLVAGLVSIQWTTRGVLLFRDLVRFFERSVPPLVSYALTITLLLWPVLLPAGLLWLALYWSVLAWGYGNRWEKLAMIAAWIVLGLAPLLVSEQIRRMNLDTIAPVRAMQSAAQGRLVGSLFHDLGPLSEQLPDSVALRHFLADLHLSIHQWELARNLYREVLAAEPGNAAAASDLGTCYFYEGNLEQAIRFLEQATSFDATLAEAYFNLSRSLSEEYRFDESEEALRRASALDAVGVSAWIRTADRSEIVMAGGGFNRQAEIRAELAAQWRDREANSDLFALWRRTMSLPLALIFVFPAILLYFISTKVGNRSRRIERGWLAEPFETLRRVLLPGFTEAEEDRWRSAFVALLVPLLLVGIPFWARVTYGVPWALIPPPVGLGFLPLVGLLVYLLVRGLRILRRGRSRSG
ncbi:MAG: tetratricopeptide repeat protein [bacterium]|nr:tetratricopeptide repeat protein [bacterium]